mmetsp:Transcript_13123/g.40395  ORF Transcript_13123/g.40395 Transcript_13123/m.40395 type:complete len:712 (-) Transcript_13123:149-2284(-)
MRLSPCNHLLRNIVRQRQLGAVAVPSRWCQHNNIVLPGPTVASAQRQDVEKDARLWHLVTSGKCEMNHYYLLLRYASPERTIELVKLMLERDLVIKEDVLKTIHRKFTGTKYSKMIFEIFETHCQAANCDDDHRLVERLFYFYLSTNMLSRAANLFDRLSQSGTAGKWVYHGMMNAYAKAGRLEDVQNTYDRMLAAGFTVGHYTIASIITAFGVCKEVDKARELFHHVSQKYSGSDKELVCTTMINCLSSNLYYKEALAIYDEMCTTGPEPTRWTYNAVLKIHTKTHNVDAARRILRRMRDKGLEPQLRSYNELLLCLGNSNLTDEAQDLFDTLLSSGPQPDFYTYSMMMRIQGDARNPDMVKNIFHQMREGGIAPNLVAYSTLINTYCLTYRMSEAEAVFNEMVSTGIKPDTNVFHQMIEGHFRCHKMIKAENVVFEMIRYGIQPTQTTFTLLLRGYVLMDNNPRAEMLFETVKSQGFKPNSRSYGKMLLAFARENCTSKMEELLRDYIAKGMKMTTQLCNEIMFAHIQGNNRQDALKVYEQMKSDNLPTNRYTYAVLIDGFVRMDGYRCETALKLFKEWKGTDFMERWSDGTIFVNLCPYSVCSALTCMWLSLKSCPTKNELRFFVGSERAPTTSRIRHVVMRALTDLNIRYRFSDSRRVLAVPGSELHSFQKNIDRFLMDETFDWTPFSSGARPFVHKRYIEDYPRTD